MSNVTEEYLGKKAGESYKTGYSQAIVLTLQSGKEFEKGKFLRKMKTKLGDYEIRNYSECDGKPVINLVSKSTSLTEKGTNREIAETDALRINKIINGFDGLKLEDISFQSVPCTIKRFGELEYDNALFNFSPDESEARGFFRI